jgi:1,4-dihydroxy-2-naphthoate octaprenyltransferase
LYLSFFFLALGSAVGLVTVLITGSLFILTLGLIGLFGGFFYTAPPLKIGYHSIGEVVIAFLFGILPVTGSYFLQTGRFDLIVLAPAVIVAVLIFLVILINEFPDRCADTEVGKRTLVVSLGVAGAVRIYRIALIVSYLAACASVFIYRQFVYASLFYILTAPLAIAAIRCTNKKNLSLPGNVTPNSLTIALHTLGCLALTAGFIVYGLQ